MAIISFPSAQYADEQGLVAIGGDLEVPSLLLAYSQGIFPWPIGEIAPLAWFSPDPRGVLRVNKFHLPHSLKKFISREKEKKSIEIRFNFDFQSVINHCAQSPHRKDHGTWITQEIIDAYILLHQAGYAFSVETYFQEKLVGGLYGVSYRNCVSGESMFYLEKNASKLALYALILKLQDYGIAYLDTQMSTSVVKSLGGEEVPRSDFLRLIKEAQRAPIKRILNQKMSLRF
jgi:leucyl/phenylalanyl-tRNA---protein transferase